MPSTVPPDLHVDTTVPSAPPPPDVPGHAARITSDRTRNVFVSFLALISLIFIPLISCAPSDDHGTPHKERVASEVKAMLHSYAKDESVGGLSAEFSYLEES